MAIPSWLLVFVGGRRPQHSRPSPTVGSFRPSHLWRHKSRTSLRGLHGAHGVVGTPHGEVRDMVCYVCVDLGFVCGNIDVATCWFVWALDNMCVWGTLVVIARQSYNWGVEIGFRYLRLSNLVSSEAHLVYYGACVCSLGGNNIYGCCIVEMWVVWRFVWGRVLVVCGWCMAICVISLRVFSILICVGGK